MKKYPCNRNEKSKEVVMSARSKMHGRCRWENEIDAMVILRSFEQSYLQRSYHEYSKYTDYR